MSETNVKFLIICNIEECECLGLAPFCKQVDYLNQQQQADSEVKDGGRLQVV